MRSNKSKENDDGKRSNPPKKKTWIPLDLNSPAPFEFHDQISKTSADPQKPPQSVQAVTAKMRSSQLSKQPPLSAWSTVSQTESNIHKLHLLCNSDKKRKGEGYVLQDLSEKELYSKVKCSVCNVRRKGKPFSRVREDPKDEIPPARKPHSPEHEVQSSKKVHPGDSCYFHPGSLLRPKLLWSCCMQHVSKKGCTARVNHDFGNEQDVRFVANWKYHETPQHFGINHNHRAAVCIDMEMGYSSSGDPELIRITAIDFFTQATLIDRLVSPTVRMQHLNTKYSGVTPRDMAIAVQKRTCIFGRDAARDLLFRYIGPDTVIIAHGGSSDLTALRILHPHVIDTQILESYYGLKTPGGRSLKNLIKMKKGLDIQMGFGHDSLEDSLACRELVVDFVKMIPDA